MKKNTFLLVMITLAISVLAQTPQAFKYQAVARDNAGNILANQNVSFKIVILKDSVFGAAVYREVHEVIINELGLVNLEIGNGNAIFGLFEEINWGDGLYFLKVWMDQNGGIDFLYMGTSQLLSVPFALYSEATGDTTRWRKSEDNLYYLSGNVGIGTTTPERNMDIRSSSPTSTSKILLGNSDNTTNLLFNSGHETANPYISFKGMNALRFLRYDDGINELMRIQSDGRVGIGTLNPNESALLDLSSNSKGFLLPRLSHAEIAAILNPADGLQVYNTDDGKLYIYVSGDSMWREVSYGLGLISPPAFYTIGTGGACNTTIVNGYYQEGNILTINNFVTIEVDVTSLGSYTISTDTVNGYSFSRSGNFVSTGIQNVDLAGNGTCIATQTDNFTASASNSGGACTFSITVEADFPCVGPLIDSRDGKSYNIVLIGTQCWMAENLNIGTMIDGFTTGQVNDGIIHKYCFSNNETNCDSYGGLYIWGEMMEYSITPGSQGICAPDWHIPTDEEWKQLEGNVDSYYSYPDPEWDSEDWRGFDAGLNLRNTSGWSTGSTGTDLFGFAAYGGGWWWDSWNFLNLGSQAYFFTSSNGWYRNLDKDGDQVSRLNSNGIACSVRCLHD